MILPHLIFKLGNELHRTLIKAFKWHTKIAFRVEDEIFLLLPIQKIIYFPWSFKDSYWQFGRFAVNAQCSESFKVSAYNELSNYILSISDLKMYLWLFSLYESFVNANVVKRVSPRVTEAPLEYLTRCYFLATQLMNGSPLWHIMSLT